MDTTRPVQEALIPEEATPDMLVDLLPKAQNILKASATYLAAVRKLTTAKSKQEHVEKWGDLSVLTETLYDSAELAQKTLDAWLAIETMLSKPLKSRNLVMLADLRRAFREGEVDEETGEIL